MSRSKFEGELDEQIQAKVWNLALSFAVRRNTLRSELKSARGPLGRIRAIGELVPSKEGPLSSLVEMAADVAGVETPLISSLEMAIVCCFAVYEDFGGDIVGTGIGPYSKAKEEGYFNSYRLRDFYRAIDNEEKLRPKETRGITGFPWFDLAAMAQYRVE